MEQKSWGKLEKITTTMKWFVVINPQTRCGLNNAKNLSLTV